MSRDARELLEEIAVDMILLSLKRRGMPRDEIVAEARSLTDDELFELVTEM